MNKYSFLQKANTNSYDVHWTAKLAKLIIYITARSSEVEAQQRADDPSPNAFEATKYLLKCGKYLQ